MEKDRTLLESDFVAAKETRSATPPLAPCLPQAVILSHVALAIVCSNVVDLEEPHSMRSPLIAAGAGIAIVIPVALQRDPVAYVVFQNGVVSHEQVRVSAVGDQPVAIGRTLQAPGDLRGWAHSEWIRLARIRFALSHTADCCRQQQREK